MAISHASKEDRTYFFYFNLAETIDLNSSHDGWYGLVKDLIRDHQASAVWISEAKVCILGVLIVASLVQHFDKDDFKKNLILMIAHYELILV